ncbi:MAG: WcbI family polysaccharide biosynthesis putative acetyltransferase [Pseudomonadota bacterium]
MKILFYGNCQTEAAMNALAARNPKIKCEYAGNSRRVIKYNPERTTELMEWCDHIVTQPVMNLENPDHHDVLRARFAGRITFMPYLWLDGLYSLCGAPGARVLKGTSGAKGHSGVIGEEIVIAHIKSNGLAQTVADFRSGALDFGHRKRFDDSLAELERREESADIKVAAQIRNGYRDRVVMLTHNHPHPLIVNDIAQQIADRLNLSFKPILPDEYLRYSTITLPEFGKVLSPYTISDLGLKIPYDLQWLKIGRGFIADIASSMGISGGRKRVEG